MSADEALDSPPPVTLRRVLLVGFMGAGKTSVGRALARELGWAFRDFDEEVVGRLGLPIDRIFKTYGEEAFRSLESRVAGELLGMDRAILSSGGGWPCRPGRLEDLGEETLSIWLRVSPEVAVERCAGKRPARPLLESEDPVARARELLEERSPYYALARWTLDSSTGDPRALAERLAHEIRANSERPLRE